MIDADFMMLMQDANFTKFLQDANLKQLLTDANLKQLTNDAALAQLANDAELAGATAERIGRQANRVPTPTRSVQPTSRFALDASRHPGQRRAYVQRWLPYALVLFLCLVVAIGPARAQLASLETPGLQLVYVDPSGKYLVPHVERAFLNSLEFQRRVLGFAPTDDITVLLLDLADGGNAGATAVPHDLVLVQMAPLSHAFETVTANERMTMIMNHELVHVTTMDRPAGRDRLFRKLFVGKVRPTADHPETILYSWLTAPRAAAPRWYIEGAGVFFDTWMAGRHRPRAGRLRRDGLPVDGARRHGVLRPARPDLGRHQDRLQRRGELLPVRHALHDLARAHVHAGEGRAVDHQAGAQPRVLRERLRAHLRPADGHGLGQLGARRARVPAAEPRGCP